MSKYIPTWTSSVIDETNPRSSTLTSQAQSPALNQSLATSTSTSSDHQLLSKQELWQLDDSIANSAPFVKYPAYPQLAHKFEQCIQAINLLKSRYQQIPKCIFPLDDNNGQGLVQPTKEKEDLWKHAIVLAHIAAKRTDDPKIGVGAVLIHSGTLMTS